MSIYQADAVFEEITQLFAHADDPAALMELVNDASAAAAGHDYAGAQLILAKARDEEGNVII